MVTTAELTEIVKDEIERIGVRRWAARYGYSPSYASDLKNGLRPISEEVAEKVGYRLAERLWERVGEAGQGLLNRAELKR